jgi:hypothetical protein
VALSIKGEALAASVSLRSRAAQTLVLGAISGAALFVLDRRAGHDKWIMGREAGKTSSGKA